MKVILEIVRQLMSEENGIKQVPKWIRVSLAVLVSLFVLHAVLMSDSWKVKMTVVMDTPEGTETGSSVWRIYHHSDLNGSFYKVDKGEAVVIDLGKRGLVFALLRGADGDIDYSHHVALTVFPKRDNTPIGTTVILPPEQYPMFVRFRDMTNPKTVENLYGTEVIDSSGNPLAEGASLAEMLPFLHPAKVIHIPAALGVGVRIESVTLEVTNDDVSLNLEKLLPWLSKIRGHTLEGGDSSGARIYERLDTGDFQRGG